MSSLNARRWLLLIVLLLPLAVWFGNSTSELRAADGSADRQGLASSARPILNDAAQRWLQQIAQAIQSGEFSEARSELRRLLDSSTLDGIVPVSKSDPTAAHYESVTGAAQRLLNSLPKDERQQFVQQNEPEASRRLQTVLSLGGSTVELQNITDRFPGTSSARRAGQLLISRFLDRGQLWQASAVLQKLKREATATNSDITLLAERLKQIEKLTADPGNDFQSSAANSTNRADAVTDSRAWQAAAAFEDSSVGWFQQALDEHRRQSIPVLPRLNPAVADGVVIGRTLNHLFAVEVETGRPLWQADSPATGSQRPSRVALTGALESLAAVSMARQVQLDTTYSRMSVDDDRVLCVEYVSGFGRSPGESRALAGRSSFDETQPQNQLVARRSSDGSVEWTRSAFVESDGGFEPAVAYFTGVPTVVEDWLVGLLQHDAALFVYGLDRHDGTPQWMLKIGERAGSAAADADWTSTSCPIVAVDGLLICSTGAGLITAVDPVFGRVVWARRYDRSDEPPSGSPLPGSANRLTRRWWSGWREVTLLTASPTTTKETPVTLLYAGPDVTGVRVLDAATGEERTKVPASQPLFLQMPGVGLGTAQPGLLVERHAVTAFDPASGATLWTRSIPEPVGRGFFFTSPTASSAALSVDRAEQQNTDEIGWYLFPAADGTTRLIRLSDGLVTVGRGIDAGTPRTWTLCAAGIVEQTFEDLQLLPLPTISSGGELQWPSGFGTETGRDDALLAAIREANSPDELRDLVTRASLVTSRTSRSPDTPPGGSNEFDRPGATHAVAAVRRARELQADSITFDLLLALSEQNPNGAVSLREDGPERVVRYDRWVQGQLTDLLTGEDSPQTTELRNRFATVVEAARNSRDPFALSRLVEHLRDVPSLAAAETQPEGRVGRSFLQNEIALLRLSAGSDPEVAGNARRQLVELYLANRYERDAAAIVTDSKRTRSFQLEARSEPNAQAAPNDEPLLSADRTAALLASIRQPDWKAAAPQLTERPERFEEVRYFPVPVTSSSGTLFDRLNVAVRLVGKTGSSLRFYGDGQAGYWKLELPASESTLHTWFTLPRGWSIGRLLILRVGTELYGIAPYSDSGEPRAQLRWTLDMADGNRLNTHQLAHPVPGFGAEDLTPLDGFDQPMAHVGPVQAGYLCYRDRGLLVCLDPETGQQLWTRAELPPRVRCLGDEHSVWLLDETSGEATELRATDGAALGRLRLDNLLAGTVGSDQAVEVGQPRLLMPTGHQWLVGWPRDDSPSLAYRQLAAFDARTRQINWSLDTSDTIAVCGVGRRWFGALNRTGQLEIRDVASGTIVAEHQVDFPQGLRSAHCLSDEQSHIVVFSSESDAGFQAVGEPRFGFRTPLINGQLIAISAHDGSLLWQQPVNDERLLLDQPRSLPIITLTSRIEQAGKSGHALRVVDRLNGRTLQRRKSTEQFAPFTFDPNAALQRVVVRFPRSALRIDYDPR